MLTETPYKGKVCIQKHSQPLLIQKKSTKTESVPTRKSSTKHLPKVTLGFISAPSLCWLRNNQWKLSPCRLCNHHRNRFQKWRVDSSAPTAPFESEIVNENWVVADSEITTETPYKGDVCIRKRSQPLLTQKNSTKTESVPTQKSSTKHLPQVTPGFVRAHNPFWFINSQQKLSRCRLRNHQRNRFHRWREYSSAHPPLLTQK